MPQVETESVGIFWVGEREFNTFDIETGVRFEDLQHRPTAVGIEQRDFSTISTSIGLLNPINDYLTFSALLDYSSRAPTIEELYSNGPHLATQSFEIGNPNLDKERATGLTLSANYENRFMEINVSGYYMDFADFIYQQNVGTVEDGLPVFTYRQNDASFRGLDVQGLFHPWCGSNGGFGFHLHI